jgi:hypothetical protein
VGTITLITITLITITLITIMGYIFTITCMIMITTTLTIINTIISTSITRTVICRQAQTARA